VRKTEGVVAHLVDDLLDDIPSSEPFDFMSAFANPLPKEVMLAVMGFPPDEADRFQRLLTTIEVTRSNANAGATMISEAHAATAEFGAALVSLGEDSFAEGTVLGALVRAGGAAKLDADSITSMAAHIATVGSDPTSGALGNSLIALATHPEAMDRLRREPALMRMAVHELLRFDSPTHIALRFAVVDTELAGRRIRRGETVMAMVGAANRDPAEFPNPNELDLDRDARRQLGFGQGEHICLGAPLALLILETALGTIIQCFSRIELVAPPEIGPSVELRIPDRVVVRVG
jgi:cytochrome P450